MEYDELKKNVKILLVDDDIEYLQITSLFLRSKGYNIITCSSGQEAVDRIDKEEINIILIDYYMPGMTGEEAVKKIREKNTEVIIILQTGYAGQQPPIETLERLKIQNYYDKADGADKLHLQVLSAVRIYAQQTQILLERYKRNALGTLIAGIAQEMKDPLMTLSAGLDAEKVVYETGISKEEVLPKIEKLNENNKKAITQIDKVLNTLISQTTSVDSKETLQVEEIMERLECILFRELKANGLRFEVENLTKPGIYIGGRISDAIFILFEVVSNLAKENKTEIGETLKIKFSEDSEHWYIQLFANNMDLPPKKVFLLTEFASVNDGMDFTYYKDEKVIGILLKKIY